jgi:hypothetical protein
MIRDVLLCADLKNSTSLLSCRKNNEVSTLFRERKNLSEVKFYL